MNEKTTHSFEHQMAKSEHPPRKSEQIWIFPFDYGRFRGPRNHPKSESPRLWSILTRPRNVPKVDDFDENQIFIFQKFAFWAHRILLKLCFRFLFKIQNHPVSKGCTNKNCQKTWTNRVFLVFWRPLFTRLTKFAKLHFLKKHNFLFVQRLLMRCF